MAGRPNNAAAIAGHIQGLSELKAKFQALPAIVRTHMNEANEITVRQIQIKARRQLESSPSIQTRSLWGAIDYRVTKTNGTARVGVTSGSTVIQTAANFAKGIIAGKAVRVKGIVVAGKGGSASSANGAKVIRPSRYSHLVEFGSARMKAEAFMMPAAESERGPYVERCKAARAPIVRDLQSVGSTSVALGGLI